MPRHMQYHDEEQMNPALTHRSWGRSASPQPHQRHTQPHYAAPRSRLADDNPGELEVLVGLPQWKPQESKVFVTVDADDGTCAASEELDCHGHHRDAAVSDWHEGLGGALILSCTAATRVTLHVMASSPHSPAHSLGGTTIMLPEPSRSGEEEPRRRLQLVAPLDITIELAWTPMPAWLELGRDEPVDDDVRWSRSEVEHGSWRLVK
jgi:hypothetical protein